MIREFINIYHNNYLLLFPGFTTYTLSKVYTGAGDWPLEWTQHQLVSFHQVKSHPKEIHGLLQCGGQISARLATTSASPATNDSICGTRTLYRADLSCEEAMISCSAIGYKLVGGGGADGPDFPSSAHCHDLEK